MNGTFFLTGILLTAGGTVVLLYLIAGDFRRRRQALKRRWYESRALKAVERVQKLMEELGEKTSQAESQPQDLLPKEVDAPAIIGEIQEHAQLNPDVFTAAIKQLISTSRDAKRPPSDPQSSESSKQKVTDYDR